MPYGTGPRQLIPLTADLSDYLQRYAQRKPGFPDHPRSSPRRARRLLDQLGQPERPCFLVRIVGTKGKGSTAAILESITRAAGYRTGFFSSPHLHSPRERIRVMGTPISRPAFAAGMRLLLPLLEGSLAWDDLGPATLFEALTALGMLHFARQGVEIALVEAGMGGRMDATHACPAPITLLTPMALDHQIYLGDTLEAIAAEKAGAIPHGGLALSAPQLAAAQAVIEAHCREVGATLLQAEPGELPPLGLAGPHQRINARLALAAVDALRDRGWEVPERAVEQGMRWVHWPGRLETVAGRPWTVVDTAHNPAAAAALAAALAAVPPRPRGSRCVVVLGCSDDKDLAGIVAALAPRADGAVVTRARHHRAAPPQGLAELWAEHGVPTIVTQNVGEALQRAREWAGPDGWVCATGSVFVVADAREALGLAVREPWPEPALTSSPSLHPPPVPAR